ncbi:TPA: hypothetical protein BOS_41 [Bos taurus]|nr:TPA: hypothetical protein BOS_41 [Bos taurus]
MGAVAAPASSRRLFGCPSGDQRPFFLPRASGPYRVLHVHVRGHFRSARWACESAHPLRRRELARLLALVFPSRSGRSGAENRSAGDPQASGASHRLRTLQRSAPETRLASSSALSRGRPPTPTRTLVDLGAAPYNRSSRRSGAENRSAGDPQASGTAHRLRTRQHSTPKTRLASS